MPLQTSDNDADNAVITTIAAAVAMTTAPSTVAVAQVNGFRPAGRMDKMTPAG